MIYTQQHERYAAVSSLWSKLRSLMVEENVRKRPKIFNLSGGLLPTDTPAKIVKICKKANTRKASQQKNPFQVYTQKGFYRFTRKDCSASQVGCSSLKFVHPSKLTYPSKPLIRATPEQPAHQLNPKWKEALRWRVREARTTGAY